MNDNIKKNEGITLVALIITIIILLILAVVTISAVNEGSLFAHANNAAAAYSEAATQENTIISNYLTELEKHDKELQDSPENPVGDPSDIRGTYYAANGNTDHTIVISDSTFTLGEITADSYNYSDGVISATFPGGAIIINYNYSTLGDGTKLLYTETPRGTASLLATDISKFTTGTLTGTYTRYGNGINFVNATDVELLKGGDVEETKTYKYFTQYNIISIGADRWFKLEGNNLIEFLEIGSTATYTKQS